MSAAPVHPIRWVRTLSPLALRLTDKADARIRERWISERAQTLLDAWLRGAARSPRSASMEDVKAVALTCRDSAEFEWAEQMAEAFGGAR